ncbi:SPOR domain-containing protein [Methylomicrobium lacus]|uniref:SPOR domain-containing protein n=1 Tax=Methylomicrobium lacus TaxID=136992 RepID=UPI0035A8D758
MTEPANKKSKEGRYRADSNLVEAEPAIEPWTDLDSDEDAIDRLLIHTGFDAEADFFSEDSLDAEARDIPLATHENRAADFDAFSDDEILAALQTGDDEPIEPVDLGSPISDIELTPAPLQQDSTFASAEALIENAEPAPIEDDSFWTVPGHADEFNDLSPVPFDLPAVADEAIEPVDLGSPVAAIDPVEAPISDNAPFALADTLFESSAPEAEAEPKPLRVWQSHEDDEAAIAATTETTVENDGDLASQVDAAHLEKAITPDIPATPADWSRLLSMQEDAGRKLEILENKTRNAGRLSYAALALALTALCAALTIGYLDIQTRAELSKLKTMTAILEEDVGGLSEKSDNNSHSEEDSEAEPSHFSDGPEPNAENKAIVADVPPKATIEPIQAELAPKPLLVSKDVSPSVRKTQSHAPKPVLKTGQAKTSGLSKPAANANETGAHWTVNLASFRQIGDARKKAAEFQRKGVSVKMMKVDIQHATWYRLAVPGFKTKEAASAHSTKLKKLLRLNSIWVAAI